MTPEALLSEFAATYDAPPAEVSAVVEQIVMATLGTAIAGSGEDGCDALLALVEGWSGRPEATVFVRGARLPAPQAALVNGVMCRALDYCDAMAPGLHVGSSLIPAALAVSELVGGCTGRELLEALAVGAEVGSRMNLSERAYGGLDPTGVAGVFSATAAAGRVLRLTPQQMRDALALAFNRAGGSFQSNVDGSLAVRLIQGWVAETGVTCALLARSGLTGPRDFLSGVYGYARLYAKGERSPESFVEGLGGEFRVLCTMFKKYPSCGLTQGVTELALAAQRALGLDAGNVAGARVRLPPYAYRLVGHPFAPGNNPRVDAQFSAQYCVANAILERGSRLADFRPERVARPEAQALAAKVEVVCDAALDARGHTAVDLSVTTTDGRTFDEGLDIAPGFPGNTLETSAHVLRFRDCLAYAPEPPPPAAAERLLAAVKGLEALPDARALVALTVARSQLASGAASLQPEPA